MPHRLPLRRPRALALLAPCLAVAAVAQTMPPADPAPRDIKPVVLTSPVSGDPDDPAVWVNRRAPARSLILGTNKVSAAEGGALYVWDLDGKEKQVVRGIDRPNNIDIEQDVRLSPGAPPIDIAAVTERNARRLRLFRIRPDGSGVDDLASLPVFEGETGEQGAPMGIALYRRPKDGALFAIVGRKEGPTADYLWQYRLTGDGRGGVKAVKVRAFGAYSGRKEIEAICVDDALGYVYYADERVGIRKYAADPNASDAGRERALFGTSGFAGDHEGIAVWTRPDGTGYVVCTDQMPGSSAYRLYRREGEPGRPHDHARPVALVRGGSDETDGIEAVSAPLGPRFPRGLLVTMDSTPKRFRVFDWRAVAPPEPKKTGGHGRRR